MALWMRPEKNELVNRRNAIRPVGVPIKGQQKVDLSSGRPGRSTDRRSEENVSEERSISATGAK